MVVLSEPEHGGLSYISQSFVLPAGSKTVSFRYRFVHGKSERNGLVPPDSLMVFLTNNDNGSPMAAFDGWYANTAFYTDSDGVQQFDTSSVAIIGPDNDKSYWVRMQTGAITVNTNVTIEIGLACADNGVNSFAVIDDVSVDCPPKWCCDSADEWVAEIDDNNVCTTDVCDDSTREVTHTPVPIDDGDPCTADSCDPLDGVLNEPILYCGTDIVFMLDASGSISTNGESGDWVKMRAWVKNAVDYYENTGAEIRVAVGRFSENGTSIGSTSVGYLMGQSLTDEYDILERVLCPLTVGGIVPPVSPNGTNLFTGLFRAKQHFNEYSDPTRRKILIIMTDGWITNPGYVSCQRCQCESARQAAESQVGGPTNSGIEIFVAHFESSGSDFVGHGCCEAEPAGDCSDEYAEIRDWLKNNIVSGNSDAEREAHMFYDIIDNADGVYPCSCPGCEIPLACSQDSDCNDGRDCTVDSCANGFCVLDGSGCE